MRNSGKFRGRSALLLSSTVGLALALSACTSVEYTAKEGPNGPKIATVNPAATPAQTSAQPATAEAAAGATPAAVQTAETTTSSQPAALPTAVAVKGGRVALPPASEIAAAAAITAQMQPHQTDVAQAAGATSAPTAVAALAPTGAAPAAAAIETAAKPAAHNAAADLPQVVAVKGSFPPAPPPPGSPSIGTELTAERKVIPLPKPDSTVLAYAAGPTNAALAAIRQNESMTAPLNAAPAGREKLSGLITKYATMYDVPEDLVHRVV
jgi:hypothetical protein